MREITVFHIISLEDGMSNIQWSSFPFSPPAERT